MFLSKVWSFKAFRSWACTTFFVYASSNVPPLLVHRVTPWRLHHCNFLGHIARLMRKKQKQKRAKGWKGIKIGEKSAIFLLTPLSTGTQFVPCSHTAPICSTFSSRHSSHRGRVFTFGPLAPMARWREKGKTNKNLKACN